MKTTAQKEFNDFLESQLTPEYIEVFESMNIEQQQLEQGKYTLLKLKANAEVRANQKEADELLALQSLNNRTAIINEIRATGYQGNGCITDFEKLYNHPEVFGKNWHNLAIIESQKGIDNFINKFIQYKNL